MDHLYFVSSKLRTFLHFITFGPLRDLRDLAQSRTRELERVEGERDRWRERDAISGRRYEEALDRSLAQQEPEATRAFFAHFRSRQILTGKVTEITDFEVRVDIGGMDYSVHVPEFYSGDSDHPSELVYLGKKVYVKVLSTSFDSWHPFLVLISMRQARRELGQSCAAASSSHQS